MNLGDEGLIGGGQWPGSKGKANTHQKKMWMEEEQSSVNLACLLLLAFIHSARFFRPFETRHCRPLLLLLLLFSIIFIFRSRGRTKKSKQLFRHQFLFLFLVFFVALVSHRQRRFLHRESIQVHSFDCFPVAFNRTGIITSIFVIIFKLLSNHCCELPNADKHRPNVTATFQILLLLIDVRWPGSATLMFLSSWWILCGL